MRSVGAYTLASRGEVLVHRIRRVGLNLVKSRWEEDSLCFHFGSAMGRLDLTVMVRSF